MTNTPSGITWSGLWKIFFMSFLVLVIILARDVFTALFLAIVIAAALDKPVTALEKRKIPRILATLLIFIGAVVILSLIVYSVVPKAIGEIGTLVQSLSNLPVELSFLIDASDIIQAINENLSKVANFIFSSSGSLLSLSSRLVGGIMFGASVFVLSFYLTVGRDGVEKFLITILPTAYEKKAIELYDKVRNKIGRWLVGQIILSFIVGFTVFIGLALLRVKYSLVLGILAGVLELIPYVGPIFSGSVAVLVGLTGSPQLAFYILLLFIIVQQLENHILVPNVMSMTTTLNPVVIIISLLIGVKVFGFIGLVLAIPAAVLLQEIIEDWSEKKRSGKT